MVDEGTRDCAGIFTVGNGARQVFSAYMQCWGCVHGCHQILVSVGDGCFASLEFKDECAAYGIVKDAGPAESSASYG